MQIYLVGGAVRDILLGHPVTERDWVVVGTTVQDMIAQGFTPIGKEFPVFLHPETKEEYALARTERKITKGYKGFQFYTSPEVTLEQDLSRRDLTINAMAMDEKQHLIDPYHGKDDLNHKILRHVSSAFAEDPVRILRIARFNTRFADFTVHPDTQLLMQQMVLAGEVDALVPERVWAELARALQYTQFTNFFMVLEQCGALATLFPELCLAQLHAIATLQTTITNPILRFALLFVQTPQAELSKLIKRLRIPNEYADFAQLLTCKNTAYLQIELANPTEILQFLLTTDALRREPRFTLFLEAMNLLHPDQLQRQTLLQRCLQCLKQLDTTALQKANLPGNEFGEQLRTLRINAIANELQKSKR